MIKLHKVDENGFLIVGEDKHVDTITDELQIGYIDTILNTSDRGYFKPKLVNGNWIEGASEEEIDGIINVNEAAISPEQRIAELEQKIAQFEQMLAGK